MDNKRMLKWWEGVAVVRLRPFKLSDAKYMLEWVKEERLFAMWCAKKFDYPLTEEQIREYKERIDNEEFSWCFTALDESGKPIGHFLMRKADYTNQSVHIGFVIVDPEYRGKGCGKEMMRLAVRFATDILQVQKATLGVFGNNPAAHNCYKSVGFEDQKYYENEFPYKDEKWGLYDMLYVKRID